MDLFIVLLTSMTLYKCAEACGGTFTTNTGVIQLDDVQEGEKCRWTINTHDNTQIVLVVKKLNIGVTSPDSCENNYVQITDGVNGSDLYGKQLCGTTIPTPVVSLTNVVHVNYTTTRDSTFQLEWKVSDVFEYHNKLLPWPKAVQTCAEDGGSLAERSSFTDIQIQQKVMNSTNVSDIWTGKYLTHWTWLAGCIRMTAKALNSMKHASFKANQQKLCQNHCPESNFYGLKGTKCYCLDTYTGMKDIPAYHCTDGCPGNHDERCCGDSALTLYRNDQCWDKPNPYIGTISNTYTGRTCQKWTLDTPHDHSNHDGSLYPSGSVNNASNYCRDPDKEGFQWCYTTDKGYRFQKCTIPICISPEASSTQYMCMAFRYIEEKFEAIQSRCDSRKRYVCIRNKPIYQIKYNDNQFHLIKSAETWHSSRDKCRHTYLGLTDEHAFKESFHWAGYFRNFTILSEMKPNKSPDYCFNVQKNNDKAEETTSQCKDKKAFVCQKAPITCGQSIHAYTGNITYPSTGNGYGPLLHCIWTITVDTSSYDLTLHVDIESSYNCTNDFLNIYHGNTTNKEHLLEHVCGQRDVNLTRLNGTITIQFRSDMTVNGSGFNISWRADKIPTTTLPTTVKTTNASNSDGITKASNDEQDQNNDGDKISNGVIAGICVGLIVVIAIVVATFVFLCKRNKQHQEKRKETVSTIMTNHDNVNRHPYDVNTSIDTSQLYGNLDSENLPTNAHTQTPDKSDKGIYEDEGDGNISTRETSFSIDPQTYHMPINDEYSIVSKVKQSKDPEMNNDVYNTLNESLKSERVPVGQENVYNHLHVDQDDNVYNHTDTMNETQHQISTTLVDETYSNMTGDTDDTTYSNLQGGDSCPNQAVLKSKTLAQGESTYSHVKK